MEKIRILYIDDEEHNLQSFKATFRRQYEVHTAISANEAKKLLSELSDVHVIISDQRMPEVTGVEFFKEIKASYPDALRILLTGYTDIEALTEAVNEGHIYRYVTKPWSELELNNGILNAYEVYKNRVALKQKVSELQKSNEELNRFIYSISHELRAPLASALGAIQLARLEDLIDKNSRTGEYWQMIEQSCQKLDHNITSTIQYYKNRRTDIINKKINFEKLAKQLFSIHKQANNATEHIALNVTLNQGADFYGDSFRIELILSNLISNAIKYQRPEENNKKIDVIFDVTINEATITVADNGTGINPDHEAKIFNQFFRGSDAKGIGLGLFIAKEAIDKLNGTICVQSEIKAGTIFIVKIPNNSPL